MLVLKTVTSTSSAQSIYKSKRLDFQNFTSFRSSGTGFILDDFKKTLEKKEVFLVTLTNKQWFIIFL